MRPSAPKFNYNNFEVWHFGWHLNASTFLDDAANNVCLDKRQEQLERQRSTEMAGIILHDVPSSERVVIKILTACII